MEAKTTVKRMMSISEIIVPSYHRAYSWDTPEKDGTQKTHTDIFLDDLEEQIQSNSDTPYYFGHFLFEEKSKQFCVIDGQQRLTTIVIFLSALFRKLKTIRELNDYEKECYEDMIKRYTRRFYTVHYDDLLFFDYVINQTKTDRKGLETESARRIVRAFDFFKDKLSDKNEDYITKMLKAISESTVTTHIVKNETEAIRMFIFQNKRGKKPSNQVRQTSFLQPAY